MSPTPFQVKEFKEYEKRVGSLLRPYSVAEQMNAWFDELAADPDHEYEIRQILATTTINVPAVLVFYEVTDTEPDIADDPQDA